MSTDLSLPLAFVTGVLGALHCLGMCSGVAGGWFVRWGGGPGAILAYHAGRILTYGALGAAGAWAGRVLVQQGLLGKGQGLVMLAAGLVVCLLGLGRLLSLRGLAAPDSGPAPRPVTFATPWPGRGPWPAVLAGTANGLVPCSLTTSVAMAGAATGDPWGAGLLMLAFGLGTLPTLALLSLVGTAIGQRARGPIATLTGLALIALGLWTLYEGWVFFDVMRGLTN